VHASSDAATHHTFFTRQDINSAQSKNGFSKICFLSFDGFDAKVFHRWFVEYNGVGEAIGGALGSEGDWD
jgi:hypothetical protein